MSGLPFEPVHGSWVTAAEMIFDEPSAVRSDWKNDRRFAASAELCGFPAPDSFGYSYARGQKCQYKVTSSGGGRRAQSISMPVTTHVSEILRLAPRAMCTHRRGCKC